MKKTKSCILIFQIFQPFTGKYVIYTVLTIQDSKPKVQGSVEQQLWKSKKFPEIQSFEIL